MWQMTINHHRTEMGDLNVKLIHEQQKTERQIAANEQQGEQIRDLQKELKVCSVCNSISYKTDRNVCSIIARFCYIYFPQNRLKARFPTRFQTSCRDVVEKVCEKSAPKLVADTS